MTPSLVVKLSLPKVSQYEHISPLSPCLETRGPLVKPEKKRRFGSLTHSEEGLNNSNPTLTVRSTTKRQRLSLASSTQGNKDPIISRGQPEVWAEVNHIQRIPAQILANISLSRGNHYASHYHIIKCSTRLRMLGAAQADSQGTSTATFLTMTMNNMGTWMRKSSLHDCKITCSSLLCPC